MKAMLSVVIKVNLTLAQHGQLASSAAHITTWLATSYLAANIS